MTAPREQEVYRRIITEAGAAGKVAKSVAGYDTDKPTAVLRRWGTIIGVTPQNFTADVRLSDGSIIYDMKHLASYIPATNERVTLDVVGTDMIISGTLAPAVANVDGISRADRLIKAQVGLTGGGAKRVTLDRQIGWSSRIMSTGQAGFRSSRRNWPTNGWFTIGMPPDGTAIPIMNNSTIATVANGMIPMPAFSVLWYEIPQLVSGTASDPSLFRITTSSISGAYEVPDNWIMIASINDDGGGVSMVRWGTGEYSDPWRPLPLSGTWTNNSGGPILSYKKIGDEVRLSGRVERPTQPTVATVIGILPVGYRIDAGIIRFPVIAGGGTAFGAASVSSATGNISWLAGDVLSSFDLSSIRFDTAGPITLG